MAEQTGKEATGIKGAHSDQRDSFGRSNLPVTHQEGSSETLHQDSRIDARLPGHDASWTRPLSAYSQQPSADNCTGHSLPRFRGSQVKLSRASSGTPSPVSERTFLHHITPTRRQPSGPVASHPAGFSRYTPCCRPDSTTILGVNKSCYMCVILRLSLWTILQHPTVCFNYRSNTFNRHRCFKCTLF